MIWLAILLIEVFCSGFFIRSRSKSTHWSYGHARNSISGFSLSKHILILNKKSLEPLF